MKKSNTLILCSNSESYFAADKLAVCKRAVFSEHIFKEKAVIKKCFTLRERQNFNTKMRREIESTKDDGLASSDVRLHLHSATLRCSADQARKVVLRNRRSGIVWAIAVSAQNCPSFPCSAGHSRLWMHGSSAPTRMYVNIHTGYTVHSGRFRCAFFFTTIGMCPLVVTLSISDSFFRMILTRE